LKASQLQLNPTKTQVMWLGSPQQLVKVYISEVLVASASINVSEMARNLGVIIDIQLMLSAGGQSVLQWLLPVTAAPTARQIDVI